MKNIKNIIFDLGAVIIDIHVPTSFDAFANLSGKSVEEVVSIFKANELFERHETGHLSDELFRNEIRRLLELPHLSDLDIDTAWNALLLEIPPRRIELLQTLAKKYRLFLLSNTNQIHYEVVEQILHQSVGIKTFEELFEKVYLSHRISLRKPNVDIYHYVLNDAGLKAEESLFIDDNEANILSAQTIDIQTIHLIPPQCITELELI